MVVRKDVLPKPGNEGHRGRLRQKQLEGKLTDLEFLENQLCFFFKRKDQKPLARMLMQKYGTYHRVLAAPYEDLLTVSGVGKTTALYIKSLYESALRDFQTWASENPIFYDQNRMENYCRQLLLGKVKEEFWAMYLTKNMRLICCENHTQGTTDYVSTYPNEILIRAASLGARSVVVLHNHPDGNIHFSTEDRMLTQDIFSRLKAANIQLLDHYLLAGDLLYSSKGFDWFGPKRD